MSTTSPPMLSPSSFAASHALSLPAGDHVEAMQGTIRLMSAISSITGKAAATSLIFRRPAGGLPDTRRRAMADEPAQGRVHERTNPDRTKSNYDDTGDEVKKDDKGNWVKDKSTGSIQGAV
jgi:hypothetical protein